MIDSSSRVRLDRVLLVFDSQAVPPGGENNGVVPRPHCLFRLQRIVADPDSYGFGIIDILVRNMSLRADLADPAAGSRPLIAGSTLRLLRFDVAVQSGADLRLIVQNRGAIYRAFRAVAEGYGVR